MVGTTTDGQMTTYVALSGNGAPIELSPGVVLHHLLHILNVASDRFPAGNKEELLGIVDCNKKVRKEIFIASSNPGYPVMNHFYKDEAQNRIDAIDSLNKTSWYKASSIYANPAADTVICNYIIARNSLPPPPAVVAVNKEAKVDVVTPNAFDSHDTSHWTEPGTWTEPGLIDSSQEYVAAGTSEDKNITAYIALSGVRQPFEPWAGMVYFWEMYVDNTLVDGVPKGMKVEMLTRIHCDDNTYITENIAAREKTNTETEYLVPDGDFRWWNVAVYFLDYASPLKHATWHWNVIDPDSLGAKTAKAACTYIDNQDQQIPNFN